MWLIGCAGARVLRRHSARTGAAARAAASASACGLATVDQRIAGIARIHAAEAQIRDPFLIAYALAKRDERWVITNETSKPTKQRANRHVSDVCKALHLGCSNTFFLIRTLDFHT